MAFNIIEAKYHRNGIGGEGCFLVRFEEIDERGTVPKPTTAVFYPEEDDREYTQVFDPENLRECFRSADNYWPMLKANENTIKELAFLG